MARSTTAQDESSGSFDAVIVGTGLAGLTVALEVLDRGGRILLVDKEPKIGGNSIKASSGINACVADRVDGKNDDNKEIQSFVDDTLASGGDSSNPELVQLLVEHSTSRLLWLKDRVGVDLLENHTRLGGHSRDRTHRPAKGTVGYTVISAMQKALEDCKSTGRLQLLLSTTVTGLVVQNGDDESGDNDNNRRICGVKALVGNKETVFHARHVVVATGGFAANRSPDSILVRHAPADFYAKLPATVGDFSTGDGIVMATEIGARTIDLEKIQIHPTGFIDPADPSNPSKILCAELMRGVGGILLDNGGQRFCNELGTRDYVTGEMLRMRTSVTGDGSEVIPPFYIVLSEEAGKEAGEHVGFYMWKNLLHKCKGVSELASFVGVDESSIRKTLRTYRSMATFGKDSFLKTNFPHLFSENLDEEEFLAGRVTPVLHYCMGGLQINTAGQVLNDHGKVIPGLFAVGEVAGGVHGNSRLAGNSLLECLVFGNIIGTSLEIK